jgi:hypothetical protein
LGSLPPKFLKGITVVDRYWRRQVILLVLAEGTDNDRPEGANRYYIHLKKEDYVEYLLSEEPTVYMDFFDWLWKASKETLLQSYDEYRRRPSQFFALFARRPMSNYLLGQVRRVSSLPFQFAMLTSPPTNAESVNPYRGVLEKNGTGVCSSKEVVLRVSPTQLLRPVCATFCISRLHRLLSAAKNLKSSTSIIALM